MSQLIPSKRCIQLSKAIHVLDKLNVIYNEFWDNFILWNKYQIFVFKPQGDKYFFKLILNFQISQVLSSQYHLTCLDIIGVVHVAKLKDNSPGVMYESFNAIEKNAIFITRDAKFTYILTINDGTYFLLTHKLDIFSMKSKYQINIDDIHLNKEFNYNKCKMLCHLINDTESLVFITFNGFLVHYVIINHSKGPKNVKASNVINCPSEINSLHYINNNILISLSIGTVIKMYSDRWTFKDKQIIHLNTAIYKIQPVNDSLIYMDGQTMWKVTNIFTDITYSQCFVKLVKDFTVFNNEILCTTYGDYFYMFSLEDETAFRQMVSSNEDCPATQLIKDKDYMDDIVKEIEKNNEISMKIKMEENFITIIALSNRQDLMNDIIKYEFEMYEKYEDIGKKCNITLTNDIKDYYESNSYYLLIKLSVMNIHQKFKDVLSNMFGNLEMHITIFSSNKVVKTITLKILEQLKSTNIAIPLETDLLENKKITILIELVIKIPGALDKTQTLWIKLHTKEAVMNAENFIRTAIPRNNLCHLKKKPDITDLIYDNANKHHGNLVKFINIDKKNPLKWKFFATLPENYKYILADEERYKTLNPLQRKLVMKEFSSDSFLSSRNTIVLNIANEKVEIDINTGFPNDFLQITSVNVQIASDIKNFLSNILFVKKENTQDFVSDTILVLMETLQQQISECVLLVQPVEHFLALHEKYQKNVIRRLNL